MGVLASPSPAVALLLACLVTGVQADPTLTALIISSCVTGLLILLLILGAVIYCAVKYNRKHYDRANNNNNKSPPTSFMANGYNPRGLPGTYNPLGPTSSPGNRAKAHTEHAVAPRQRPPLNFYTMRADPRDTGLAPHGGMRISRSVPYAMAAPPNFGTPVLYLDMLDVAGGGPRQTSDGDVPRNGYFRRYMQAPPPGFYYATGEDGGLLIREVNNGDEPTSGEDRYKKKDHKKGRGRSKSRGGSASERERSRSQPRDVVQNHHHKNSHRKSGRQKSQTDETPILAMPGDIILTEAHHAGSGETPLEQLRRSYNYSNHVDEPAMDNGRGGGEFTTTTLKERHYTMTFDDHDLEKDSRRRESVENYYLPSQFRGGVDDTFSTPFADYSQQSFPESADYRRSAAGPPEVEPDHSPTPREDYNRPVTLPLRPERAGLQRLDSGSDHEPTPRADYSARPASTEIHSFSFAQVPRSPEKSATSPTHQGRGSLRDGVRGGGGGDSFDAILNSVDLTDGGRGENRAAVVGRAPTPPFDGEVSPREVVYPSKHHSLRQRESASPDVGVPSPPRVPTPPPDIPSPVEDDRVTGELFSASIAARPPTPPPGRILRATDSQMEILRDLLEEGAKGKQQQQQQQQSRSSPAQQQQSMPAYPFMAELKRRQRDPDREDDDDDEPARSSPPPHEQKPMNPSLQARGDDILRGLDAVLSPNSLSASRSHIVSFAEEPPRIIPGSSTSLLPDYDTDPGPPMTLAPPPPAPPPPPPPPPPPSTNFNHRF